MTTRHDYRHQALTYDRTRAASASVMRGLLAALEGAPGPELGVKPWSRRAAA